MVTYFEAREPAVNLFARAFGSGLDLVDWASGRGARGPGVTAGVLRPDESEGVILPLDEGVMRPLDTEAEGTRREPKSEEPEGVMRPDRAGVTRPPREDTTEGGRDTAPTPTVGGESLEMATNTPQLTGQEKYSFLNRRRSEWRKERKRRGTVTH